MVLGRLHVCVCDMDVLVESTTRQPTRSAFSAIWKDEREKRNGLPEYVCFKWHCQCVFTRRLIKWSGIFLSRSGSDNSRKQSSVVADTEWLSCRRFLNPPRRHPHLSVCYNKHFCLSGDAAMWVIRCSYVNERCCDANSRLDSITRQTHGEMRHPAIQICAHIVCSNWIIKNFQWCRCLPSIYFLATSWANVEQKI